MRRTLAALALLLVVPACGGGGADGSKAATNDSKNTVDMKLIAFKPEHLAVRTGDTVTWRQHDAGFHTVTSGTVTQEAAGVREQADGKFASGELATGKTFSFKFNEAGTFSYFCSIHPATMRGDITVA